MVVVKNILLAQLGLIFLVLSSWCSPVLGQNKVSITSTNPSAFHLCAESEWFEIDVRNITTSTLTGLSSEVILPTGMIYEKGSVSGTGVTESNVSNLQKPIFSLPNLSLAASATFKIKVLATCNMISFLANGGLPQANVDVSYPGGKSSHTAAPFTVFQPSVKISTVTNQFATVDLGSFITRIITITNGGKGKLAGFTFRQINENGLQLTGYSGGTTSVNGDTTWSKFDKIHFLNVGNGDSFLSQNEYIRVYDTIFIKSCSNLKSYFNLNWGCNKQNCGSDNASATLTISTKTPKLDFTPKSSTTVCMANSNKHLQELTIKNSGNDTARKLLVNIFQGVNTGFYQYELSRIDETDIQYSVNGGSYKRINPINTLNNYSGGGWSCLGGGAVASVDLSFADLPPNATIHIKWFSISCCTNACNMNFYAHRWKYKANYANQCSNTISSGEFFGSYGYYQGFSMSEFTPSDVINNQDIELVFNVGTASLLSPASNAELIVEIKLPSGLSHSGAAADVRFENDNNQSWQPNTVFQRNDTVFAIFKGSPKITLPRSELKIKLKGDCSSSSANTNSKYGVNLWYNPSPSCQDACNYLLYCFTSNIRIHCDKSCNTKFRFSEFEAKRISYGQPDNDNDGEPDASGSLNMSKIKLERVMYGDTLKATFRGKINAVGSTTTWRYLKASSTIDYGYYMKPVDVRLKIYRAGNLLYNCNGIAYSYSTTGNSRTFTFDVGVSALISAKCPLYSGFLYGTKDSIELEVKYMYDINPGNAIRQVTLVNDMYLSTVANPTAAQRYQCDTFGGKFVMIGYYFTNWGKNIFSTNSCNEFEVYQGYYLSVGSCCSNYAGGNIFPYEYRNWAELEEAMLVLPQGFEVLNARMYQYRTTGTGSTAWQYVDSLKPMYQSKDTVTYNIKALHKASGGSLIPGDDGFHGVVYYKLRANCAAKQGTSLVTYDFHMRQKNFLGSSIDTVHSNGSDDVINYEKPYIVLAAEENDVKAKSDTAVWNIRLTNSSYISQAKYVWLSYTNNGNTKITEIRNRKTGQVITPTNDIFKLGDLAASGTYDLQIKAIFNKCDKDSFQILTGFDCAGYPVSLAQYPCPALSEWLSYTPVNTRISAELNDSNIVVNLCEKVSYTVKIANEGEAKIYNIYLDLILREGMILDDTSWGFNPGTNDSFMVTGWTYRGNGIYRANISPFSNYLKNNGLPGFTSGQANEFKFKFALETNCDFVSSSYFLLKPGGNLNCGKPVITSYGIGKPINITGVNKPYFSHLKMDMAPLDVCNYNGRITFKFINLGPDTTGVKDKIQLLLPKGIYVDTNYLQSFYNGPVAKPTISQTGQYKAEWPLPDKTIPGDSSYFEVRTYVIPSEIECGYTQIIGQAIVKQPALCVKDSTMCNIDVATSSALILDSIQKSVYNLTFVSGISVPQGNQEKATISYRIKNIGSVKETGTLLQVKYVEDLNGNLRQDPGEKVVFADTILQSLERDSSVLMVSNVVLNSSQTCRLLLLIDSTNCICDVASLSIPPIRIINAGRDTAACSHTKIVIGSPGLTGSKYTWSPGNGIAQKDSSLTTFNYVNFDIKDQVFPLILTTNKGSCSTKDTALITLYPAMQMQLPEYYTLCKGDSVIVGEIVKGGKGFKSYQWSPGYALNNPNSLKVWAKPSVTTTYDITIKDAIGCILRDTTEVRVVPRPQANFTVKDTCALELFSFADNSTLGSTGLDSVYWDFGAMGSSNAVDPVIFIDSAQALPVRYYIIDSVGCSHDTTKNVTAFPLPKAGFMAFDDCQYNDVNFINQSTIAYGSFTSNWLVEGKVTTLQNYSHRFTNVGAHIVVLTGISDRGCIAAYEDTIDIHPKPNLTITANDVCKKDSSFHTFTNLNGSDSFPDILWSLGDGTYSSNFKANHLYNDTGNYSVVVVATTAFGCKDTAAVKHEVHSLPKAAMTVNDRCLRDTSVIISSSTIDKGSIVANYWDIGNGIAPGAASLKHRFPTGGMKILKLIVESDFGCKDTIQGQTYIHGLEVPNMSKTGNCEEALINFVFAPQNSDSLQSTRWVFNNVDTLWGNNVNMAFSPSGNQKIELTTLTKWGCNYDSVFTVRIDPKPVADFSFVLPCADNDVDFTNTSQTLTGSLTQYNWDLDDGNISANKDVDHSYQNIGSYDVTLNVRNSYGCSDTISKTVDISNIVVPDFDFTEVCVFDSATFTNTSTGLPLPAISNFKMGNGSDVSNQNSFNYAYQKDGSFLVKLTVSTSAQCTYDTSKWVQVFPLPVVGFDLDPPFADILNSDVRVIDKSSGAKDYFYWLSDGNTFYTASFTHHFVDSGSYVIRQILTTDRGCVDSFERSLSIGYLVNILLPNAFSPNNDGLNDVFGPGGLGLINYDLTIFNRWGEKVYQTQTGKPWDGADALPGNYIYALKMFDYKGKIHYAYGHVLLLK